VKVYKIASNAYRNHAYTDSVPDLAMIVGKLAMEAPVKAVVSVAVMEMNKEEFEAMTPFDGFISIEEIPNGSD